MPTLHVIAGPNGCGKSTLTRISGFSTLETIDPDEILRHSPSLGPIVAARDALRRRRHALDAGRSHLVETTLAGTGIFRHIDAARRIGYRIVLHFVSVDSPAQALDRIRNRVAMGGHDVPETDVRRRFVRSHANLPAAIVQADETFLYDNTDPDRPYREVAMLGGTRTWFAETPPDWVVAALAQLPHPIHRGHFGHE